jgi:lysophospholipase L1-like esterase
MSSGGSFATGGAVSGGAASGGGASAMSGGTTSGGAASGGANSGGAPDGGSATGGSASGGDEGSGGANSGGQQNSGGSEATGGSNSDGGTNGAGGAPAVFSPCPDAPAPCVILPLGDSITEGFGSSGGGYRVELFKQAVAANKNITFVGTLQNGPTNVSGKAFPRNHQGHGGFTIDTDANHSGISGSITQNALNQFKPDIVLLMIGTNDINGNVDIQNAPNRLGRLVDDITTRAPDTLVVVASIAPVVNSGTNSRVMAYNGALPGLVETRASQGKHVIFVDNYASIATQPNFQNSLMADNLHPNDAGYAALGASFYDIIEDRLR